MSKLLNSDKLTILVCTTDSYDDLWEPFFKLLSTYWESCECEILLNSDSKDYSYKDLNIKSLKGNFDNSTYGSRMLAHANCIDTEYTLLLLDDFFIREKVNLNQIDQLIDYMESNTNIASINFDDSNRGGKELDQLQGYIELPKIADYKLNMQAAIWKTTSLREYWDINDNPWKWEIFGNYQTFNGKDCFVDIADSDYSPFDYGYNSNGMGVYRGRWVKEDVVPLFDKHNIIVDFEKRGFYEPLAKTVLFESNIETLKYIHNRIGTKYFLSFIKFKTLKKLGFYQKYNNHIAYLNR